METRIEIPAKLVMRIIPKEELTKEELNKCKFESKEKKIELK